jgi:acyl-coenzyme A thioesterase PaaI-like protein
VSDSGEVAAGFFQASDDPRRSLLATYADATRRTIDQLMTTTASSAAIARAVELLEQANVLLAGEPHGRPYEGVAESSMAVADESQHRPFFDYSPVVGECNPLAAPLQIRMGDDKVEAVGVFGAAYEGPPGCVHGGYIAAAFDELLGFVQTLGGRPGMTGRLQVRYRQPTPLHRQLHLTGWVERVDGRKTFTKGTLHAGDTLTAESEGLFIAVDFDVFRRLMQDRPA